MTRPVLIDLTRAVVRCWQGRPPNGIDRVGEAYAAHFADRAQAVVQLRGRPLIFSPRVSQALIAAMRLPRASFRRHLTSLWREVPAALGPDGIAPGSVYLNVTHTDFDLAAHHAWVRRLGVRPVYLLHDLIPLSHPEVTTAHKAARHRGRVDHALRHASAIIVNSCATAQDLAAYARERRAALPPVLVAPLGVAVAPVADRGEAGGETFFVSLGTIERRKNQITLLRAWQHLIAGMGDEAPRLVLVGGLGACSGEVRALLASDGRLRRNVSIRTGLEDGAVQPLLARSRALLFPSRAEGFGLPVAEALAIGVPVIASDLPALREIGGGIPTLIDPLDSAAWAQRIAQFCGDSPEREGQLARMASYRANSWADHFAALDEWLPEMRATSDLANSRQEAKQAHWHQPTVRDLEPLC
jgi:glycosyltransferase involved in cell wall biosynthesis